MPLRTIAIVLWIAAGLSVVVLAWRMLFSQPDRSPERPRIRSLKTEQRRPSQPQSSGEEDLGLRPRSDPWPEATESKTAPSTRR